MREVLSVRVEIRILCHSRCTEHAYSYLSGTMGSTRIARLDGT